VLKTKSEKPVIEKFFYIITIIIVIISFLYAIVPMTILQGDYVFQISDGLDGFGGKAQFIHDKGTLLNPNKDVNFATSDISKHYFAISYDIYTVLSYGLGYLPGQILTRIFGVLIGFFALQVLLKYIFEDRTEFQTNIIYLVSVAYAITPLSPSRMFAFATLPLVVLLFLKLREKKHYTWVSLFALLVPFFSMFTAVLVFVLCMWCFFTVVCWIKDKKANINLCLSFVFLCISTIILYRYILYEALSSGETNRSLIAASTTDFWLRFKVYLQDGQYHSSGQQGLVLLPTLVLMTIWVIIYYFKYRNDNKCNIKKNVCIISTGWFLWIFSALIEALQEYGFKVGITLIDGFQWGRLVGFMRPMWYMMIMAFVCFPAKNNKIFKNNLIGAIVGLLLAFGVWNGLHLIIGNYTTGVYLLRRAIPIYVLVVYFLFSLLLFTDFKYKQIAIYGLVVGQIFYVSLVSAFYNDTGYEMYCLKTNDTTNKSITLNEFYSTALFEWIKMDINYDKELVAAYGFHPSVLMYNGFETIDRYEAVHSMKMQCQFREIIAPSLELYPNYKEYYDTWGGRMYLFGELGYEPDRNKNTGDFPLYINTEAFKKYGGKYILSRARINNCEDLGLNYVNDYNFDDSLYHIYLYEAK
jgi:hypothetical protein